MNKAIINIYDNYLQDNEEKGRKAFEAWNSDAGTPPLDNLSRGYEFTLTEERDSFAFDHKTGKITMWFKADDATDSGGIVVEVQFTMEPKQLSEIMKAWIDSFYQKAR